MRVLAILQNMWDDRPWVHTAPLKFRINPLNYSGKRLYKLVGDSADLWVTNASRQVSRQARVAKTELDLASLETVLSEDWDLVLVCGRVAQGAVRKLEKPLSGRGFHYMEIDHPAARRWSKEKIRETQEKIQALQASQ